MKIKMKKLLQVFALAGVIGFAVNTSQAQTKMEKQQETTVVTAKSDKMSKGVAKSESVTNKKEMGQVQSKVEDKNTSSTTVNEKTTTDCLAKCCHKKDEDRTKKVLKKHNHKGKHLAKGHLNRSVVAQQKASCCKH